MLARTSIVRMLVLGLCLALTSQADACSWVRGYFYQVTSLRGTVVGKSLGPLQYWTWLRQSFTVPSAELILHDYAGTELYEDRAVLAKTVADKNGHFDFGSLSAGHYVLEIKSAEFRDFFDVEIVKRAPETDSVMIDVSPNFPDCKGGHEFKVKNKS